MERYVSIHTMEMNGARFMFVCVCVTKLHHVASAILAVSLPKQCPGTHLMKLDHSWSHAVKKTIF